MTTPDQSKGDRSRDEVLAGEYVLGVLDAEQRRLVEQRIRRDHRFAGIVSRWEENLSRLNGEYGQEETPKVLFRRMEERLWDVEQFGRAPGSMMRLIWNSLIFWRTLSIVTLLLVAGFAGFRLADGLRPTSSPLVAELNGKDDAISLAARFDERSGRLTIAPIAAADTAPRSLELWLSVGDNAPKSLGVLPQSGEGEIMVPVELRSAMTEDVTLAVSLEPLGGSPTGQATGPVIAIGDARF